MVTGSCAIPSLKQFKKGGIDKVSPFQGISINHMTQIFWLLLHFFFILLFHWIVSNRSEFIKLRRSLQQILLIICRSFFSTFFFHLSILRFASFLILYASDMLNQKNVTVLTTSKINEIHIFVLQSLSLILFSPSTFRL